MRNILITKFFKRAWIILLVIELGIICTGYTNLTGIE